MKLIPELPFLKVFYERERAYEILLKIRVEPSIRVVSALILKGMKRKMCQIGSHYLA